MPSGHVTVAPDSTGKAVDAQTVVSTEAGAPTVLRQTTTVGSPTTYGNVAEVNASNALLVAQTGALPAGTNTIGRVNPDVSAMGIILGSLNAAATVAINGGGVAAFQVTSSSLAGSVTFEGTVDGTNWYNINAFCLNVGYGISTQTSVQAGQIYRINTGGFQQVRARVSAYTSGTSTWATNYSTTPAMSQLVDPVQLNTGSNVIGGVTNEVNPSVYGTPTAPLFAPINLSASGLIVAANAKTIRVLSLSLIAAGSVSITWQNGTVALSGAMPLVANSGYSANAPSGLFATSANSALNLLLSAAISVQGHISYVLI